MILKLFELQLLIGLGHYEYTSSIQNNTAPENL